MTDEPMAGGQTAETACTVDAFQRVCVTADVNVTPTARCGSPVVTCVNPPRILTGGAQPCQGGTLLPTGICSFTIAQELCIQVPVTFGALTDCTPGSTYCFPPSTTDCTHHASPEPGHPGRLEPPGAHDQGRKRGRQPGEPR